MQEERPRRRASNDVNRTVTLGFRFDLPQHNTAAKLDILYGMQQALFGFPAYQDNQADGVK